MYPKVVVVVFSIPPVVEYFTYLQKNMKAHEEVCEARRVGVGEQWVGDTKKWMPDSEC